MKTNPDKNRLRQFATLALAVSKSVLPNHGSRFAPKTYTQPQLLACLLLKEYLRLDYRTAQEMLELSDGLRSALELSRVPDHSTLWWFARHKLKPELLQAALEETVRCFEHYLQRSSDGNDTDEGDLPKGGEGASRNKCSTRVVALDSTGLFLSYSSRYFRWRAKRERGQRGWLKWALALWVEPQMLVAQLVRPGPSGDFGDLVPLAESANSLLSFDQLLADAGYDSEANHRFCREVLGVESLIRAKARRSKTVVAKAPYRKEMCRVLEDPGEPVLREQYRQRWKVETTMSVAKRKWGESLTARREELQKAQLLLRGVTYNLHRLVLLGLLRVRVRLERYSLSPGVGDV
jgi:DDE family transposase